MIRIKGIKLAGRPTKKSGLFAAPHRPGQIRFDRPTLIAAIARAAATEIATVPTIRAVEQAVTHLLLPFIDDSIPDLAFSADLEQMTDNTRTAISGWVGAGLSHLYMLTLGYVFCSTGRGLYSSGQVFDIAYGGGRNLRPNQIVGAEAKGSFQRQATIASIIRVTNKGYDDQIKPHIDTKLNGYDVVHGYAVGAASNLAPKSPCKMYVVETQRPLTHAVSTSNPVNPSSSRRVSVGKALALQNYRAVFVLMGAEGIVGALDAALRGDTYSAVAIQRQLFQVTRWRDRDYLILAAGTPPSVASRIRSPQFGIAYEFAEPVLLGLNDILHARAAPFTFPSTLPEVDFDLDKEIARNDGGAQFPDGSALLDISKQPLDFGRRAIWTAEQGLLPF